MANDFVSIAKTLVVGAKLMTDRYKKNTHMKIKGQCKEKKLSQKD